MEKKQVSVETQFSYVEDSTDERDPSKEGAEVHASQATLKSYLSKDSVLSYERRLSEVELSGFEKKKEAKLELVRTLSIREYNSKEFTRTVDV